MTEPLTAIDPATGETLGEHETTTAAELERLLAAAAGARNDAGWRSTRARAAFLTDLAGRLRGRSGELIALAHRETGLSEGRLTGEIERTCQQIEMFVALILGGDHYEAIVEPADPTALPAPRPDLRRLTVPLGPVAVFAASNFPFFLSVAGGDTISALAAGCPVICKAHPGHPGTSAIVAEEIRAAGEASGLPPGTFGLVQTASLPLATRLVTDDRIEAVGFTGSLAGGRAIFDAASRRPRPVPVYAEMGSVNPVVVTAAAAGERAPAIAESLAGAITREAGQLCTKPGLIFVAEDEPGDALLAALRRAIGAAPAAPMLGPGLLRAATEAASALAAAPGVEVLARGGRPAPGVLAMPATVYRTTAAALRADPSLADERFGPIAVVATYASLAELLETLGGLAGQLTGSIHIADGEPSRADVQAIVDRLVPRIGRLVVNGVSTGVAVTAAQFHGGPYPATTMSATTSVGTLAIRRYLRPLVFQDAPAWLLPAPLRD